MSAFVCCTRRGLAEELAAKTRAKGLECGHGATPKASQVAPRDSATEAPRNHSADRATSQGTGPPLIFFCIVLGGGLGLSTALTKAPKCETSCSQKPVTKAARKLQCRPSDKLRDLLSFCFFFFWGGGPVLVMNSNDFVVVSLVYRQAKGFAHGELSEPGRFSMGRVSVSYITDLEVRR